MKNRIWIVLVVITLIAMVGFGASKESGHPVPQLQEVFK